MKGDAEGDRRVVTALGGAHQAAQAIGQARVAPAEVVEDGDARRVGADGDDVAQRLVDGEQRHRVGVAARRSTG